MPYDDRTDSDMVLSPQAYAHTMLRQPFVTSDELGWSDVTLQRYSLPGHEFDAPPSTDLRLGIHVGGPLKAHAHFFDGHEEERWWTSDHFSLTPRMSDSRWTCKGKTELILLHLKQELLVEVASSMRPSSQDFAFMPGIVAADSRVNQFMRLLMVEAETGTIGSQLYADGIARSLSVHLLRHYCTNRNVQSTAQPALPARKLKLVFEFIRAHLADDISLSQIAEVSGLGPTPFGRAFRLETGSTPYQYLLRLRVEEACELLKHTLVPVTEVGLRCGFAQPSHFSTMFRRSVGMTPGDYRRACR